MEQASLDTTAKLESLILASEEFRALESYVNRYCPFEATGMVRQEIRHSHFLAYIVDPNRPHEFEDLLLKELLYLIAEGAVAGNISKLDFHFLDLSNLRVVREWKNIDILIEIENANGKGLVIAIENKVDSVEHSNQLSRYKEIIDYEYSVDKWDREFVFLTVDGTPPSEKNSEIWQPMSLEDLITRFSKVIDYRGFDGPSVDSFKSYEKMLRRHILRNNELEVLARKIWAQHREALETLYNYSPDLNGEILDMLGSKHGQIAKELSDHTGYQIVTDDSTRTILRFAIKDWDNYQPLLTGDGEWTTSGRVFLIELMQWGKNQFRISFVIGPGDQDTREAIYQSVLKNPKLKIGRRTATANTKWKHLSATVVLKSKQVTDAENAGTEAEALLPQIIKSCKKFLDADFPHYNEVIEDLFD